ncbi:hypothetical protein ACF09Z_22385 [Streptomyces erythrochromogenes]|uniref:hypothetical protein n=1 Tax=Streptomyces erythrochromogenes TaxID=285574 RepID=UPI0036FCB112
MAQHSQISVSSATTAVGKDLLLGVAALGTAQFGLQVQRAERLASLRPGFSGE